MSTFELLPQKTAVVDKIFVARSTLQSMAVPRALTQGLLWSTVHHVAEPLVLSDGILEFSSVGVSARTRVVRGETFHVELDDDRVYLRHPRWSLMGVGETLAMAEVNLLREAHELAHVMADMVPIELSDEAKKLRAFAKRFL